MAAFFMVGLVTVKSKIKVDDDEPGAEQRFLRGINKALNTPPKPFTPAKDKPKGKGGVTAQKSKPEGQPASLVRR